MAGHVFLWDLRHTLRPSRAFGACLAPGLTTSLFYDGKLDTFSGVAADSNRRAVLLWGLTHPSPSLIYPHKHYSHSALGPSSILLAQPEYVEYASAGEWPIGNARALLSGPTPLIIYQSESPRDSRTTVRLLTAGIEPSEHLLLPLT